MITEIEIKVLLWVIGGLLGVIAFIFSAIFVPAFLRMGRDIGEIKTDVKVIYTKHENLEKRVDFLEEHLEVKKT